ncbi:hypothetical protein F5B20DRAFT_428493 [Whalleya microplaca]|nr:hypothetical protein F5B20DRAFT_428493 [Whalleya microplaca]
MDSRFSISREDLYTVHMDVKQMQIVQSNHAERLSRLEKRQADDAAMKSVWNSPFPSALGGTPQHGPIQMPPSEMFDDFEEQGQNLLGSLHLDAEDEPARRGAASRANSVRFDESALQSSSWAQNGRHSGDFGPIRPGSGLGNHPMERSLSHKSDGRHSSAGHSVHSIHSHHSIASDRGSSLGLNTTFMADCQDDDSPIGIPGPPPSLFILGSVPSIVRCWLTANFTHDTLLYADICTGSQKSVIDMSLIKELDLLGSIHRELDGFHRIRLPVYLTEATVSHAPSSRGMSPAPQMPNFPCTFEVAGMDQPEIPEAKKAIRIFIGSEALREHSADILFSQNRMTLLSSDRAKLSVPFVRPEDNTVFKNIRTMAVFPEKPKLNATARPFVFSESKQQTPEAASSNGTQSKELRNGDSGREPMSPSSEQAGQHATPVSGSNLSESGGESENQYKDTGSLESASKESQAQPSDASGDNTRRTSAASGIWNSWRHNAASNGNESKDSAPLSGYQPAGRGGRSMKVLKPMKSSASSSARTGAAYELPPPPRTSGEHRRKSQSGADTASSNTIRWESKRTPTGTAEIKPPPVVREARSVSGTPRTSTNPVGGASAFSWMNPSSKPRTPTSAAE